MQLAYLLKKVLGCDFGVVRYLAPEYTQSGQITDKADVYSFGVVLLKLITGWKAVDLNRPRGEQCLTEWAQPLLGEKGSLLVDPRLENRYSDFELHYMLHAAACCIRRDPQQRPRMSQISILMGPDGLWKLCDFGSTSTNHKRFEKVDEMGLQEDNIRKYTTPAYRAPEGMELELKQLEEAVGSIHKEMLYLRDK